MNPINLNDLTFADVGTAVYYSRSIEYNYGEYIPAAVHNSYTNSCMYFDYSVVICEMILVALKLDRESGKVIVMLENDFISAEIAPDDNGDFCSENLIFYKLDHALGYYRHGDFNSAPSPCKRDKLSYQNTPNRIAIIFEQSFLLKDN